MIKDLKEGMSAIERIFIKNAEEKMGARGPYTTATFTDGETETSANTWVSLSAFPYKGKVVDAELSIRNGYMNLGSVKVVEGADTTKYVPHAPINTDAGMEMIRKAILAVKDPDLQVVAKKIIEDNAEKIAKWSAAKSVHHNYISGLLYHVCRMLANVSVVSTVYNLDKDLLSTGVILHDIGKLKELDMDEVGNAEYSVNGNLFGHLYLGAQMVDEACEQTGVSKNAEKILLLKHMILSHHQDPEYGAVKRPATVEAYVLSMLDMMDSHIWIYENKLESMEPGTCSQPVRSLNSGIVFKPQIF